MVFTIHFFLFNTNNSYMRIVCLVLILMLLILLFPITLKTKIDFDFLKNKGVLSFYLFGLRIKLQKWKLGVNKIIFFADNKKESEMILFDFNNQSKFKDYLIIEIVKRIEINTFKLFATVGVGNYAMYTSIINVLLNFPSEILLNKLNMVYKPAKVVNQIIPSFFEDKLSFAVNTSITISLSVVLVAFWKSFLKIKKRGAVYGK